MYYFYVWMCIVSYLGKVCRQVVTLSKVPSISNYVKLDRPPVPDLSLLTHLFLTMDGYIHSLFFGGVSTHREKHGQENSTSILPLQLGDMLSEILLSTTDTYGPYDIREGRGKKRNSMVPLFFFILMIRS